MAPDASISRAPHARAHRHATALAVLLAALALLAAGGCAPEEDELSGPFGPGSGGAPVAPPVGTVQDEDLVNSSGDPIGQVSYDDGYFTLAVAPAPGIMMTLDNAAYVAGNPTEGPVQLVLVTIAGRPDTPCRFQAAVQARDAGYTIDASGDRTNARGLEFHQVNLHRGATEQRFWCARVRANTGVLINGLSPTPGALSYRQVHTVLNSVRP